MQIVGPWPDELTHQNILDFARVRKRTFVDNLGWRITHSQDFEHDQYDLPHARYIVAYRAGECVGGTRLVRSDCVTIDRLGKHRTMVSDFLDAGLIDPGDITQPIPEGKDVWEMTRFVSDSPEVTKMILDRSNAFLAGQGATQVLTISPRNMGIALKRMGYKARKLSKVLAFDDRQYLLMSTQVT